MHVTSEPLIKEIPVEAKDILACIVNEIHTTIVATVDDDGLPVTAAIDMMESDENGLYFLTAKGKGFYDRLKKRGFLVLTAIKGCVAVCPQNCIEKSTSRSKSSRITACTAETV